jgi:outer membrane immunogenic protein
VRAGVAVDRALIYGKVGVAQGQFALSQTLSQTLFAPFTSQNGFANASGTFNGVLLGAGIEYAFAPNWSAKLEYNHIDYLGKTLHFNGDGLVHVAGIFSSPPFDTTEAAQADIVKIGVNYRFGAADFAPVNDLPARSPVYKAPIATTYDWTGCYAGAHAGGGVLNDLFVSSNPNSFIGGVPSVSTNGIGGLAGGQLGCNVQTGHIVFGLEGEAAWSGLKNSFDFAQPGFLLDVTDRNRWSADLAVRAGVAVERALIYGKVGVAEGQFGLSETVTIAPLSNFANGSGTLNGVLLGAGIEYALAPNWSAKLEYNHIDYFGKTLHFDASGFNFNGPFDQTEAAQVNIVKAGINYRFGGADQPLADRSRALLPAVAYNWTGCYAGVQAGGGVLNDLFVNSSTNFSTGTPSISTNGGGGLAGGQFGCNIQAGHIVFGIEGEAAWSGLKDSFDFAETIAGFGPASQDVTDRNRWSADVSVRAGVALDRALIYGKVGVAQGQFGLSETITSPTPPNEFANASGTLNGLLLGAGLEYALAPNWSAKLEYNHIDYFGKTLHFNASAIPFNGPFDQTEAAQVDIVKAGINYRFGGADLPLAERSRALLPAPAINWTGCYAGVHAGGGVLNDPFVNSVFVSGIGPFNPTTNGGGGLAGGQLGCNIQTGAIVFGFEGEAAWSGLKNSFDFAGLTLFGFGNPTSQEDTDRNRWSADLAVRAGVALDRALIYGKVGVAQGQFEFSETATLPTTPPLSVFTNGSGNLTGVLLGAGIEYAFAPNWSAKLEYNHIDYLAKTLHFNGDGVVFTPFDASQSAQVNLVKAGINYRFFAGANTVTAKY